MNKTKFFSALCAIAIPAMVLTSCSDDDDPDFDVTLNLNSASISYDTDGVWNKCYDTSLTHLDIDDFTLSHSATDWGGGIFSWYGFCPSKSSDTSDHTADWTWIQNQWGAITGGGLAGKGTPFLVGCWNSSESPASSATASCTITYDGGEEFEPDEVYVTNSSYAYYTMLNGSSFNKVFTDEDWFHLIITGYRNGTATGNVTVKLADGTRLLDRWQEVELDPLGTVDAIVFTMESSDTGTWGMNTPGYFCIDHLKIETLNR